jgi:hypothetical protein
MGTDGTIAVQQRRELEVVFVHERSDLLTVFFHCHSPHHKRSLPQRLIELVHQWHFLQTGMTPGGPEIEQHHLAPLVLQAQELPVKIGQLEIGGRLGLVYGPEAGGLYERCYRGRDNGLSMQEDHKPYHYEAHTCSPESTHRRITFVLDGLLYVVADVPFRDREVSSHRPEPMWLQTIANSSYQCTVLETANLDHILTMSGRILTMLVRIGPGKGVYEKRLDGLLCLM